MRVADDKRVGWATLLPTPTLMTVGAILYGCPTRYGSDSTGMDFLVMAPKNLWLITTLLLSSNCAIAQSTTTIIVGPSATVRIDDSNGNSVSASAGTLIINSDNAENTQVEIDGKIKASVRVINDDDLNIHLSTEVSNETNRSNIVIEGNPKNIQIHSTDQSTTITIPKND
jgi:spore coat protein U-like protein